MTALTLDTSAVTAFVEDATAAPSLHNAQPWKFRFHREQRHPAAVRRPGTRTAEDGSGQPRHVYGLWSRTVQSACRRGAAGREPAVRLLPDDSDPVLLAEVDLTGSASPDDPLALLQSLIRRRHTSRRPFLEEDIPEFLRDQLCLSAHLEGTDWSSPTPGTRSRY